jgi:predicted HTH transcriptional regulator
MALLNRAFDVLSEQDLLELITSGIREDRSLEYKQQMPGSSDGDKKEFLADVSSFANASGGFLVFGMNENQGLPISLPGIAV